MTEPPDYEAINSKFARDSSNNTIDYDTFKTSNCDPNQQHFTDDNIDLPGYSSAKTLYNRYCLDNGRNFYLDRQQRINNPFQSEARVDSFHNWRNNTIQEQGQRNEEGKIENNDFGNFVGYHRYGGVIRPVFKRGNKRFYNNGRKVRKGTRLMR
jgi:hypothetical protein